MASADNETRPTEERPQPTITRGFKDRIRPAATVMAKAFTDDPSIRYMLSSMTEEKRLEYLDKYMQALLTAAAMNKGVFYEANDWSSAAVWMPPRMKVDNPFTLLQSGILGVLYNCKVAGVKRMLFEFTPKANAAKKKGLGGRKDFWYLFFIGTLPDKRRQGLSSALIKEAQDMATKDNLPIWLESTTENSMRVYSSMGFKLVETIVMGKGVAGSDGRKKEGGEGVTVWAMIWEPPKETSTN